MEIKSITLLDNRDIEITTDKGTITVSKKNPVYEGLRLQFFSLGINTWNWVGNQSKYSPQYGEGEQLEIPFSKDDLPSIQIGSEGEYWTQTSTEPPVYFNEEWNK